MRTLLLPHATAEEVGNALLEAVLQRAPQKNARSTNVHEHLIILIKI